MKGQLTVITMASVLMRNASVQTRMATLETAVNIRSRVAYSPEVSEYQNITSDTL